MELMDITGYQALTVPKVRRAQLAVLGHVVLKEKKAQQALQARVGEKAKRAWLALLDHVVLEEIQDKMEQTLTTETGNSVRGKV